MRSLREVARALAITAGLMLAGPAMAEPIGVRHDGVVIEAAELGGWRLYYFGYTFCPDVCPTSLLTLSEVLDQLGPAGDKLTPVFVTVDPTRDTPELMQNYVSVFHPRLVGLTPTEAALSGFASAYKVKWNKVDQGADRPYLMDHSASLYLVDPTGALAGKFPHQMESKRIAEKITGVMNRAAAQ